MFFQRKPTITPAARRAERLAAGRAASLVDVREPARGRARRAVEGATHIPLGELDAPRRRARPAHARSRSSAGRAARSATATARGR